jgi:polyhydroxyalkanoate synthase subunit PhaC
MTPPPSPDRRLAPRPLPAHLASAIGLWLSSRTALPFLKPASPFLKNVSLPSSAAGERLRVLAAEIDAFGPDRVASALDDEIARRAEAYLAGLEAYRRHPCRRPETTPPVLWQEGTTRLLDYRGGGAGAAVLVVPSLINRYYVLDLLPERSFLCHLAGCGLRPLVVDWGGPGAAERGYDLTCYIERLDRAFAAAAQSAGAPLAILGYCMGGLFALALALRQRRRVACLALLATPWDFHAAQRFQPRLLGLAADGLAQVGDTAGIVPVEAIQSLFFMVDPFLAERKFVRFAGLDSEGEDARSFVALEDWINDGVPLALAVARNCMRSWYGDNEPGRGLWRAGGRRVQPQRLRRPALVVIPGRDRIVPPSSAEPLAAQLGSAEVLRPSLGHVGMMSAARAPAMLWTPIAEWLRARLSQP